MHITPKPVIDMFIIPGLSMTSLLIVHLQIQKPVAEYLNNVFYSHNQVHMIAGVSMTVTSHVDFSNELKLSHFWLIYLIVLGLLRISSTFQMFVKQL